MKIPAVTDLDGCVGKHTSKNCGCSYVSDDDNRCAHFVCRATELNFEFESFMKKSFTEFALCGFVSLILISAAFGQNKKPPQKPVEPTAKEAIKQIFLNGDIRLTDGQHCQGMGTNFGDKTILDFLSGVLSFQTDPKTKNNIDFAFKKEKNKFNELIWVCDVLFRGGDEESPSGNGIRFSMRNSNRKLMRGSLMCIGTG